MDRYLVLRVLRGARGVVGKATGRWMSSAASSSSSASSAVAAVAARSGQDRRRVVISGAGPTGLTAALLLAKYGVPSVVLERGERLPDHPKAHCINQRTMEVFRGLGFGGGTNESTLADRVKSAMPPIEQWRSFVYCSGSLLDASSLLGTVDHFKGDHGLDPFRFSPEPVAHLPQHRLVPMLADMCDRSPLVDLRMGQEVTGFEQTADSVRLFHRSQSDAHKKTQETNGAYLVAADGAHSLIRKSLGIEMDGAGTLQHLINIYFTAPTLAERLVASDRMGMLYFVFGASHVVVLVAHDLGRGEFVAQVPFFPPLQGAHSFGVDVCRDIIRDIAGGSGDGDAVMRDVVVHDTKPWAMAAAVATGYRADRVFLAGDAAHVVPPAGAFGMNTGIQDAHNLAWKLAVAMNNPGTAEVLLDSYDVERRPVAIANMNLSVDNFHEALAVARVIGLDFDTAQSVNSLLSSGPLASLAPASVRQQLLGAAMSSGLWMGRALAKAKQRELDELFESGRTLRLQYPKEDIGFAYHGNGSFVHVEPEMEDAVRQAVAPKPRDEPFVEDVGSFVPGKRLPHFPMRVSLPGCPPKSVSSIDVPALPAVGTNFVLFCAASRADAWRAGVSKEGGGITLVEIETDDDDDDDEDDDDDDNNTDNTDNTDNNAVEGRDNERIRARINTDDPPRLWSSLMSRAEARGEDLGVLVRPDGHIYWVGKVASLPETLKALGRMKPSPSHLPSS